MTATPFHPCLKVKNPETNKAGKLFVIDYVRPSSVIRLRTLVRFHPHAIRGWGFPTKRELREMLDVQRVFMREMVRLDNEHLIDEEEVSVEHSCNPYHFCHTQNIIPGEQKRRKVFGEP